MLSACTPFDEISISHIEKMKFDILKVQVYHQMSGQCGGEKCRKQYAKLISTGGKSLDMIDKIVLSFFSHKKQNFALMHCISIYQSPNETLQLNVISDLLKDIQM